MPSKRSAGLLLYRYRDAKLEVLLTHMGGPYWARKDDGAWSIPKGEYDEDAEGAVDAALREFEEELGAAAPSEDLVHLGEVRQAGGKLVKVWAAEGDFDPAQLASNPFTMEWPKGSGRMQTFPEVDRVEWFEIDAARAKILASQQPFLDRLVDARAQPGSGAGVTNPSRE